MPKKFERAGLRFQYPENWQIDTEDTETGWSVHVQSPATAFMMLGYYPGQADPSPLVDEALATMKSMYKDLECEAAQETIAKTPAAGWDIDFVSLDFTNTCTLRGLMVLEGSLFIMSQCNDMELDLNGRVLKAMIASLEWDD